MFLIFIINIILWLYILQLRHDCDELRRLIEQCARARVRDMLSLDLRKLETELSSIVVEQIPSQPVRNAAPSAPPKCYDVKLNNYGKYLYYSYY